MQACGKKNSWSLIASPQSPRWLRPVLAPPLKCEGYWELLGMKPSLRLRLWSHDNGAAHRWVVCHQFRTLCVAGHYGGLSATRRAQLYEIIFFSALACVWGGGSDAFRRPDRRNGGSFSVALSYTTASLSAIPSVCPVHSSSAAVNWWETETQNSGHLGSCCATSCVSERARLTTVASAGWVRFSNKATKFPTKSPRKK